MLKQIVPALTRADPAMPSTVTSVRQHRLTVMDDEDVKSYRALFARGDDHWRATARHADCCGCSEREP